MLALIWYHHKSDPWLLVDEGPDGQPDFTRLFTTWQGLEWCLKREMYKGYQ